MAVCFVLFWFFCIFLFPGVLSYGKKKKIVQQKTLQIKKSNMTNILQENHIFMPFRVVMQTVEKTNKLLHDESIELPNVHQ